MKKICIVTSSRADYGLLYPLICGMQADPYFDVHLVVTGAHLSNDYGQTYKEIEKDGLLISEKIEILLDRQRKPTVSQIMGVTLIRFGVYFEKNKPDLLIVLGDRYEIFAVVSSAVVQGIPIAHLHGGEVTEGAYDEFFRHAITKMSHLHFTSCEAYRQRVIQLGEQPDSVHNVGAIGIENIKKLVLLDKKKLERQIKFLLDSPYGLVTFHPVTLELESARRQIEELLEAIASLKEMKFIITKANADEGGNIFNKRLETFALEYPRQVVLFANMGQINYLSAMKYSTCVIGNSSSGILEAPALRIPTVNIGNRQKGRVQVRSVINCLPEKLSIVNAIKQACSNEFLVSLEDMENPYGEGEVSIKIIEYIKNFFGQSQVPIKKVFYDIKT